MLNCTKPHELTDYNEETIEFTFLSDIVPFPFSEEKIREWIFFICKKEEVDCGFISFIFCSDTYLHSMNKEYLNHDSLTDVITFDYGDEFDNLSGDIFISIDRVQDNSIKYQCSFLTELSRVIAHGILHLIGYKDKAKHEKEEMREKENYYLKLLQVK
jgi:probable rRNA maturation factor